MLKRDEGWVSVIAPDENMATFEIVVGVCLHDKKSVDNRLLDVRAIDILGDCLDELALEARGSNLTAGDIFRRGRKAVCANSLTARVVNELDEWFAKAGFLTWPKS